MGWKENSNLGKNQQQSNLISSTNAMEMMLKFSKSGLGAPKYVRPIMDD